MKVQLYGGPEFEEPLRLDKQQIPHDDGHASAVPQYRITNSG